MKYIRLKNSRVYHKAVRYTLSGSKYISSYCNSFVRQASEVVELGDKIPKRKDRPDFYIPCKRCFKNDAIEEAIEEAGRISRELDDAGRLRPGQLVKCRCGRKPYGDYFCSDGKRYDYWMECTRNGCWRGPRRATQKAAIKAWNAVMEKK